jgi:hypothetical protein
MTGTEFREAKDIIPCGKSVIEYKYRIGNLEHPEDEENSNA